MFASKHIQQFDNEGPYPSWLLGFCPACGSCLGVWQPVASRPISPDLFRELPFSLGESFLETGLRFAVVLASRHEAAPQSEFS